MFGRDEEHFLDPQFVELLGVVPEFRTVAFIHDKEQGLGGLDEKLGQLLIQSRDTGPAIHNEQYRGRFLNGCFRLVEDVTRDQAIVARIDSSRIDQLEVPSSPFGGFHIPVAGHSRFIANQRFVFPTDAVEQCGFSNVGAANNCYGR